MLSQKKYMTMMELIAVMTVIILLLTVLLPIIIKSREWGKDIQCKSNLKTIAGSLLNYCGDNKNIGPWWMPSASNGHNAWVFLLERMGYTPSYKYDLYVLLGAPNTIYRKNVRMNITDDINCRAKYVPRDYKNIWACPSEALGSPVNDYLRRVIFGYTSATQSPYTLEWSEGTHYAAWVYFLGDLNNRPRPYNYWNRPNLRAMIVDGMGGTGATISFYNYQTWWARHWGRPQDIPSAYNNQAVYQYQGQAGCNFAFLDGHVESMNNMRLYNLKNLNWYNYGIFHPSPLK